MAARVRQHVPWRSRDHRHGAVPTAAALSSRPSVPRDVCCVPLWRVWPFIGARVVVLRRSNVPMVWLLMSSSRLVSGRGTSRIAIRCQVSLGDRWLVEAVQLLRRRVWRARGRWRLWRHTRVDSGRSATTGRRLRRLGYIMCGTGSGFSLQVSRADWSGTDGEVGAGRNAGRRVCMHIKGRCHNQWKYLN